MPGANCITPQPRQERGPTGAGAGGLLPASCPPREPGSGHGARAAPHAYQPALTGSELKPLLGQVSFLTGQRQAQYSGDRPHQKADTHSPSIVVPETALAGTAADWDIDPPGDGSYKCREPAVYRSKLISHELQGNLTTRGKASIATG